MASVWKSLRCEHRLGLDLKSSFFFFNEKIFIDNYNIIIYYIDMMKSKYNLKDRLKNSNYKNIDIFNYNYFTACEKESKVFQDSVEFSKKYIWWIQTFEESLKCKFYDFYIFIELMNRFHDKMWINNKNLNYILYAYEDLKLAYRFLYLWYYTTAWFHLRWFFEKNIYWIYSQFKESWKIHIEKDFLDLKSQIKECLKIWDLSCKNHCSDEFYNNYYFPTWEILKLYQHYSSNYIHKWRPNTNLDFSEKEFKKLNFLFELTLIYIPRFFKITIWKQIEQNWRNKIVNPINWYEYYWNYLQYLFWENKILTNQYSEIYNLIHDDKDNENYLKELWIDINNLFEKDYLNSINVFNSCRKKAKWDKEKYMEYLKKHKNIF